MSQEPTPDHTTAKDSTPAASAPAVSAPAVSAPAVSAPMDPEAMFRMQGELPRLPTPANTVSPLRRLGPSPFPKSGFPTLGFLETVYEHIQERAQTRRQG